MLTTGGFLHAQQKGDVEASVNFGLNFSNITDIDYYGFGYQTNTRMSYNIGASAEYYFSNNWGIKAKLIYDRKGWADDIFYFEDTDEEFITDYALNYVTIPIMANFHFGRQRDWYVNFGPYLGFLTSAEAVDPNVDVSDFINNEDFGFAYGIGYKFLLNKNLKMFFEFEGQSGINDIFEDDLSGRVLNNRFSLNTGLLFLLY